MAETPRESFEEKAPFVDLHALAEMLTTQVIADELLERTDGVWLFASFTNPEKPIDTGEKPSDLDVFVHVPDWERPAAETGIPVFADAVPTHDIYSSVPEESTWRGTRAPDRQWDCSPDEAWEQLPAYVQRTLLRSTRKLFFATEAEYEGDEPRHYDVLVGNTVQFEFATTEGKRLAVWRDGSIVV